MVSHYLKNGFGHVINYGTGYRALGKANEGVFGTTLESYNELLWYTRAAQDLNPGSKIVLDVDEEENNFRRLFISFGACIEGFKYVRLMIFLDGAFLTGKFKGCCLAVTGKNANNELYPFAFAVLDFENEDNWLWFFHCLREVVRSDPTYNFIYDRNLGPLESLPKVFPELDNFYCLLHLEDNLRGRFNGKTFRGLKEGIVIRFNKCAYARTHNEFSIFLEDFLREGGTIAFNFLTDLPYEKWSNAYSGACRYSEMTSNAAESYNKCLKDTKDLPITQYVDKVRENLMEWFGTRRKK